MDFKKLLSTKGARVQELTSALAMILWFCILALIKHTKLNIPVISSVLARPEDNIPLLGLVLASSYAICLLIIKLLFWFFSEEEDDD